MAMERTDARVGDGLEAVLRDHHRRRLDRLGWLGALDGSLAGTVPLTAPLRQGNAVRVFIDAPAVLPELERAILGAQQSVHIAGWHASPSFRLSRESGSLPLRDVLAQVAERVPVRLLLWAGPPVPLFQPTRSMVRKAEAEFTRDSVLRCALDARERTMHCHHEKIVIIDGTLAFVGGIDLTALHGDRFDTPDHPPREPLGWHDAAVRLQGPAVGDVARHFVQRWTAVTGEALAEPADPPAAGSSAVRVLRTVPENTYDFATNGSFSILQAYLEALRSARELVYLENQFLWSPEIVDVLADKLRQPPRDEFRVVLMLPAKPNNGADTTRGQLGRLIDADDGAGRLLATTIRAHRDGVTAPIYVHAKIGIIDDTWLTVGSANLNEHSLFNDTEMNLLIDDAQVVRATRLQLWAEHTQRPVEDLGGPPAEVVDHVWRPIATEQLHRDEAGLPPTHRLTLLPHVSRRVSRLQGPMRGLLVDG